MSHDKQSAVKLLDILKKSTTPVRAELDFEWSRQRYLNAWKFAINEGVPHSLQDWRDWFSMYNMGGEI